MLNDSYDEVISRRNTPTKRTTQHYGGIKKMKPSIDIADSKKWELDALLLEDGKHYLTAGKLKKINTILKSGLQSQTVADALKWCRIDLHYRDIETCLFAIDIAWKYRYYDSMLMLLEVDSNFPQEFTLDTFLKDNEIPKKLHTLINERQDLHQWIQSNALEKVEKFMSNHPLSKFLNIDNKSALETAAESANVEILTRLINLPTSSKEFFIVDEQKKLLQYLNAEKNTLLSIAAKSGNNEVVSFLIRCGIDINHQNKCRKRAVDLAWGNKHYGVVTILLKADSNYPNDFNLQILCEENAAQKELKEFVRRRNKLHALIINNKENGLKEIKEYINFDKSKLYLNSSGISALSTAIQSKKFDIYAFLKSIGLAFKNKFEEEYINELTPEERVMLKSAKIRAFHQVDKGHILYLLSKSKSQKPVENFKERIEKLYSYLDEIEEVSMILKVLQYTDYLEIVFDFDNDNIRHVNPFASKETRGTTEYKDGVIYIAAKTNELKLSGTLAHELTHLAMYVLYKNDCNPYNTSEKAKALIFGQITAKIEEYINKIIDKIDDFQDNPLIPLATVFQYPKNEQQSELIVIVPQILAQFPKFGRDLLTSSQFKMLLDYYNDRTEEGLSFHCNEFIYNSVFMKPRNRLLFLNEKCGITSLLKYGISFADSVDLNDFLKSKSQVFLLKTESTLLSTLNIHESLIIKNNKFSLQDTLLFEFDNFVEKLDEIIPLFLSPAGKIICLSYAYDCNTEISNVLGTLKKLIELTSDKKIIFIIHESKINLLNSITDIFNGTHRGALKHKITLNNLSKESQKRLLEKEITFQNEKISLNNLIDISNSKETNIINTPILDKLVKNESIEIGCGPIYTSDLEGAYSELLEEVHIETFVDKLLLQESSDIYIISGLCPLDNLVEILSTMIEDIAKKSQIKKLKGRIGFFKRQNATGTVERILVSDDQFKEKDFKQICYSNPSTKIYWIFLQKKFIATKFILRMVYSPDYYINGKRFNHEVAIEKNIKEELGSAFLSETYIISVKNETEIMRWLNFKCEQEMHFITNIRNKKIQFVTIQDDGEHSFRDRIKSNVNQTVHLLEFKKDQLIWYKTYGSFKNLCKYRAKDHKNMQPLIDEYELVEEIIKRKVSIIAGDPGTGKSTTLAQIFNTKYTKKDNTMSSHWLIRVNLKDHLQALKKVNFDDNNCLDKTIDEIAEFLFQIEQTRSDDQSFFFIKGLIRIRLRQKCQKPLFIAFDGFDEVLDDTNRRNIIFLLQYLQNNTNVTFFITTRFHYEEDLESALSTFAIKIEAMDDPTIRKFIIKSLRNRFTLILSKTKCTEIFSSDGMLSYSDAFLKKTQIAFKGDISTFIGTPLQLYLMLEDSVSCFQEWIKNGSAEDPDFSYLGNDIWEVYTNFIHRKYDAFCKKSGTKEEKQKQEDKNKFDHYHKDLAKFVLNIQPTLKSSFTHFQDIVLLVGVIRSDGRNLHFIHPTFSEFFAAKSFMNWMKKWKIGSNHKLLNLQKQHYFLNEILIKSQYRVIRAFMNTKLLKERIENLQLKKDFYHKDILFLIAKENHVGIAEFILGNFSDLNFNVVDNYGYTVLNIAAASGHLEIVKWLVEKGANIHTEDKYGQTVLHIAVALGHAEMVTWLIETGANVNAECKYGQTLLHVAAATVYNEKVKGLAKIGANVKSEGKYGATILNMGAASGHIKIVQKLIEKGANLRAEDKYGQTVLHIAAMFGHLDLVQWLVEKGVNFDAVNSEGQIILHRLARFGNFEITKWLVEKGANVKAVDIYGQTILHHAVMSSDINLVNFLIQKYANVNSVDNEGRTILHVAAAAGHLELFKWLVDYGIDVKVKDHQGRTVLYHAARFGNLEIVKWLDSKVEMNNVDNQGHTVLYRAAKSGYLDIVIWLIEKGAAINVDYESDTVLHAAAASENLELVEWLVDKYININSEDNEGQTILHVAAEIGHFEMIKSLIEKNGNLKAVDNNGQTVLHVAAASGHLKIVKYLLQNGANADAVDNVGQTVLHVARGHLEIVKALVEHNANVNAMDDNGLAILHYVAGSEALEIIKWLVEKGADINLKDNVGRTVLHYITKFGDLDTVKYLVNNGADIKAVDHKGRTILHGVARLKNIDTTFNNQQLFYIAAESKLIEMVKYLVDEGAKIDAHDINRKRILFVSTEDAHLNLFTWLLENNAKINAVDKDGHTVMYVATESGSFEVEQFLLENGANFHICLTPMKP